MKTTRDAFRNWHTVGIIAGLAAPSALPPKRGLELLAGVRLRFRTRLGPVLETEAGNSSPIIEVFRNGEYEVPVDWSNFRVIVDIGAHVGAFTCWAAVKSPAARITSFEPESRNYADLEANVSRNGFTERVSVINAAIDVRDGTIKLRVPVHRDTSSSLAAEGRSTAARAVGLNGFLRNERDVIDLVKMDCEGAEWDVLRSLEEPAWNRIRMLVLECHATRSQRIEDMVELLTAARFKVEILERASSGVGWYSEIATLWAVAYASADD